MIQRDPPSGVIERWQPELDRIAPRSERGHSHLQLLWEPGEEWAPVERWVIWECVTPDRAPLAGAIWLDLEGPPPRLFGRYDTQLQRFVRARNFLINQRQWEFYRETGFYGRPVWIVQGDRGGHKRNWGEVEQNLAMMAYGLQEPPDPPAPGALRYAEPCERTIRLLAGLDMVRSFGNLLKYMSHNEVLRDSLDRRERDVLQEMARQLWFWLGDQVEEAMTLTRDEANAIWDYADPEGEVPDYDAGIEDFIEEVAAAAPM